jgi:hypothetical protein
MTEKQITSFIEYLLKSQEFEVVLRNYIQEEHKLEADLNLESDLKHDSRYIKCAYDKCNKVFIPGRSDKLHCSDRCRTNNWSSKGKRRWNKEIKKWEKIEEN